MAKFKDALPSLPRAFPRRQKAQETEDEATTIYDRLAEMFELIEAVVESESRFQMYGTEIEAVRQLGMSFKDWIQLTLPFNAQVGSSGLIYIVPSQPLKLAA